MEIWIPYGVAQTLRVPFVKRDSRDLAVSGDWTPATGDVKLVKDGTSANVGTLPTAVSGVALWGQPLSALEAEFRQAQLCVADSATKVIEDQTFLIRTYGHHLADDPRGVLFKGTAASGSTSGFVMPSGGGISATDDAYNGATWRVVFGTGANIAWGQVLDYVGSTRTFTTYIAAGGGAPAQGRQSPVALDNTSVIEITMFPIMPLPLNVSGYDISAVLPVAERAAVADKLLGRAIQGGADGGRTVRSALAMSRNKVTRVGDQITVYAEDDSTPLWVATIVEGSVSPITSMDPST